LSLLEPALEDSHFELRRKKENTLHYKPLKQLFRIIRTIVKTEEADGLFCSQASLAKEVTPD
jgi:hypothetical protein